jgi:hypothetical protein
MISPRMQGGIAVLTAAKRRPVILSAERALSDGTEPKDLQYPFWHLKRRW